MKLGFYSFAIGFLARFLQVSLQMWSMVGSPSMFEPYGAMWGFLSSSFYGLVCLLLALAIKGCLYRPRTTMVALLLAGIILLADFAKPSRFENGTYMDHAISLIGMTQTARGL